MKKKKIMTSLLITAGALLLLAGCGNNKKKDKDVTKIGILQLIEHQALDETRAGFIAELEKQGYKEGEDVDIDFQNAQGDQANLKSMSDRLASDQNDLNLAIATQAAQSLISADNETPTLFTAITDPIDAGLVKDVDKPGGNITGTSDMVPVKEQIKLLQSIVPNAKKVGLLYNSSEPNSKLQIELAKKELDKLNIEYLEMTVTSTNDVEQVTRSIAKKVDAIYIPSDNTFTSAMSTVGDISKETQIPVIPATGPMVELGGIATYGIDYFKLGEQTAQMAVKILKGEATPETMPVETLESLSLIINEEMAKKLGIDPTSIKAPQ
ncbi:ABC transporter substrate-binding protein [Isobaculum melis]|uniref:Putative ABC transport system substrate-binding protein n=1 Tax=Isobaculum melis TaxID=142588 RepID=A0A1H9RTS3_9LACT|nr:ABC transporter substrate-binding protein [Isobaculum melis]SER76037.1 putative ABC transport system substrate-binding protein [Isobaculum melis]